VSTLKNVFAFDTETVSLQDGTDYFKSSKFDDLIQLSMVNVNKPTETYDWLIRPPERYMVSPYPWWTGHAGSKWGHGLTKTHMLLEPTLNEIWPEIKRVLDGNILIGHNAFGFDIKVIKDSLDAYGLEYPDVTFMDTKHEYKEYLRDKCKCGDDYCYLDHYKLGLRKRTSLETLSKKYTEYDEDGHHNALNDAQMLADLYMVLKDTYPFKWEQRGIS
tara:strand:- start:595 stop:1245 length:651 start_codon:yes stop_codon:yes gene_type:complete